MEKQTTENETLNAKLRNMVQPIVTLLDTLDEIKGDNMPKPKLSLTEQAQEIIRIAEESGVQSNFFFLTTFKRYQVQLNILSQKRKKSIL